MDVSIVTVHLNDFDGLSATHRSLHRLLADQQLDWIVIDGESSIQTEDQKDCIDRVRSVADYFVSESDNGIYDAMNKGVSHATGDYLLFLNAGDELHPDFDLNMITRLAAKTRVGMIWGRSQERYQNGHSIDIKTRSPSWSWYGMPAYHPSILFKRDLLGVHPYDTSYKIAADYDLVCRLLVEKVQVEQIDSFISIFHRGGISDTNGHESRDEENEVRLKHFKIYPVAGTAIKYFKRLNAGLARNAWLRGLWRKWV